jgi:hypothetical protein
MYIHTPVTNTRCAKKGNYASEIRINPTIRKRITTVYKVQEFCQTILKHLMMAKQAKSCYVKYDK